MLKKIYEELVLIRKELQTIRELQDIRDRLQFPRGIKVCGKTASQLMDSHD